MIGAFAVPPSDATANTNLVVTRSPVQRSALKLHAVPGQISPNQPPGRLHADLRSSTA